MPHDGELTRLLDRKEINVAFELPWPWAGEWFELRDIRPLNYIIGSLGSGKTRLALRLAKTLPDSVFLGLNRLEEGKAAENLLRQTRRFACASSRRRHGSWVRARRKAQR